MGPEMHQVSRPLTQCPSFSGVRPNEVGSPRDNHYSADPFAVFMPLDTPVLPYNIADKNDTAVTQTASTASQLGLFSRWLVAVVSCVTLIFLLLTGLTSHTQYEKYLGGRGVCRRLEAISTRQHPRQDPQTCLSTILAFELPCETAIFLSHYLVYLNTAHDAKVSAEA